MTLRKRMRVWEKCVKIRQTLSNLTGLDPLREVFFRELAGFFKTTFFRAPPGDCELLIASQYQTTKQEICSSDTAGACSTKRLF